MDSPNQPIISQFQILIHLVENNKCPVQTRLRKLKISNFETYITVKENLTILVSKVNNQKTKNSQIKTKQISNKLKFLDLVENYIKKTNQIVLTPRKNAYFEKKNLNILSGVKNVSAILKISNIEIRASIYVHPNLIETEEEIGNNNGLTFFYPTYKKSSSDRLCLKTLRFIFVDLDNVGGLEEIKNNIKNFQLVPDCIVQTSENSFHLYWAIAPIHLDTTTEDINGNQLDPNLILYELTIENLIKFFNGDQRRKNASSFLRFPGSYNFKPNKNKSFKAHYIKDSQTLEDALARPGHSLDKFVARLSTTGNLNILKEAESIYRKKLQKTPVINDDESSTGSGVNEITEFTQSIKRNVEYDFEANWDIAFNKLVSSYKIKETYFDKNDVLIFRHFWKNRLRQILNFPPQVREQLKGSGLKYAALKLSLSKIFNPPKISKIKGPFIHKEIQHKRGSKDQSGILTGYKIDPLFLELLEVKKEKGISDLKAKIENTLYVKGERNRAIPYDCYILKNRLNYSLDEARDFLIAKITRSSLQSNIEKRCSNDISNVDAWLQYYYTHD